jgi:hypothetical protein
MVNRTSRPHFRGTPALIRRTVASVPCRAGRPRAASVLIATIILVVVAGVVTISWVGFISHSMRSAARDRERLASMYAAEAGIEMVVDWMNNPRHFVDFLADANSLPTTSGKKLVQLLPTQAKVFTGPDPGDYEMVPLGAEMGHPYRYQLDFPELRFGYQYSVFEPFLRDYLKDFDGTPLSDKAEPIWDPVTKMWIAPYSTADLVTTAYTFFLPGPQNDLFQIIWADGSERSKVPSMIIHFDDASDPVALANFMPQSEFRFGRDPMLDDQPGTQLARLESIELIHPSEFTIPSSMRFGVITKVVATGISQSGIRTSVECLLIENRIPDIRSPGAILAPSGVVFNSNINIHWGEIWTHAPSLLVNNWTNHMPVYSPTQDFGPYKGQSKWDPWFRYRTRDVFHDSSTPMQYADIRADGGFASTMIHWSSTPNFRIPFYWNGSRGQQTNGYRYYENLLQNQSLWIVPRQYDEWKRFFLDYNLPYYYTDTQGNIWGRERDRTLSTYGEYVPKAYEEWFHCEPEDPDYWNFDELFAFIDSVPRNDNGQPTTAGVINKEFYPRDPTKSPARDWPDAGMSTVKDSGQSTHTRGVIFAATNLDMTGAGTPPEWTRLKFDDGTYMVLMPDGRPPSESLLRKNQQAISISHNGLIHTWGKMKNAGNRTIYGSIQAERGLESDTDYGAGGTPSVWYNFRMANGSWLTLNQSRVRRSYYNVVAINRVS